MTLIEPGGAETTTFCEMLSQIRGIASRLTQERIAFGDRVAPICRGREEIGHLPRLALPPNLKEESALVKKADRTSEKKIERMTNADYCKRNLKAPVHMAQRR
jgi:hypothetical protein